MAFNLTANLNVAVNTGALKAAANQINATLGGVNNIKIGTNAATFASIRPLKAQITESTDAIENFGKQAGFAAKRFAAFSVTAGALIGFIQTIKSAVGTAIDFDREMVRLSQVSNDSAQDVASVGQEITRLSTGLGVSSQDLVKVAVTLKQANLSLKDTKIALEAMAQAALAPNFDNLKDTTEGAIAIMNQFKISATGLSGALGAVNVVAGEFAVEAGDIIEAVRKTGGAFKAAGGNLNELIALFTAVRQTTRESAESIGTGLRTIFTRIQRNDTAAALKEVGINLRYTRDEAIALGDAGLEQQFVGPYEAVKRLSEGLNTLRSTDPRFSAIVEQLGGYRQISKVIPLIQEFGTAQKALGIAQAGSVSLALNAGQAQDALAVKLQKLKETFLDVGRNIVNSPGFKSLVDTFITGSTAALRLLDSLKGLIPVLAAIAAIKIGQSLSSFGSGFIKGVSGDGRTNRKADGGFIRMQKGGIVPGSGSGDKVPALLEPGEMVIPKKYARGGSISVNKMPSLAIQRKLNDPSIPEGSYTEGKTINKNDKFKYRISTVFVDGGPDSLKGDSRQQGSYFEDIAADKLQAQRIAKGKKGSNSPVDLDKNGFPYEVKNVKEPVNNAQIVDKLARYRLEKFKDNAFKNTSKGEEPIDIGEIGLVYNSAKINDNEANKKAFKKVKGIKEEKEIGRTKRVAALTPENTISYTKRPEPKAFGGPVYRQRFMNGKNVGPEPFPAGISPEEIFGFTKGYLPKEEELRTAFKIVARVNHPDRNPGGKLTGNMERANAAFTTLMNRIILIKERAEAGPKTTDNTRRNTSPPPPPKRNAQSEDQIFRAVFGDAPTKAEARSKWQGTSPESFTRPNRFDSFEAVRNASQFREKEEAAKTINASSAYSNRLRKAKMGFANGGDVVRQKFAAGKFVAKNPKGKFVQGSVSGNTVEEMIALLEKQGYTEVAAEIIKSQKQIEEEKAKARQKKEYSDSVKMSSQVFGGLGAGTGMVLGTMVGGAIGLPYPGLIVGGALGGIGGAIFGKKEGIRVEEERNQEKLEIENGTRDAYGRKVKKDNTTPDKTGRGWGQFFDENKEKIFKRGGAGFGSIVGGIAGSPAGPLGVGAGAMLGAGLGAGIGSMVKPVADYFNPSINKKGSESIFSKAKDYLDPLSGLGLDSEEGKRFKKYTGVGSMIGGVSGGILGSMVGAPLVGAGIGSGVGGMLGSLTGAYKIDTERAKERRKRRKSEEKEVEKTKNYTGDIYQPLPALELDPTLGKSTLFTKEMFAERKKNRGFASGGLVPGTGNSDTVPMDLDEGSFVIKKSSVNKIGAQNLVNAHRFESGGKVPSLLTPGEYVYSPSEAKKIGATKLNQMNSYGQLKKLAAGGPPGKKPPLISDVYLSDPKNIDKLTKALIKQIMSRDPSKTEATARTEATNTVNDIKIQNQIYNKSVGDIANADKDISTEKSNIGLFNTDLKNLRGTLSQLGKEASTLGKSLNKNAQEATNLSDAETALTAKIAQAEAERTAKKAAGPDLTQENKKVDSAQRKLDDLRLKRIDMQEARQAKIDAADQKLAAAEEARRLKSQQPVDITSENKKVGSAQDRVDDLREKRAQMEEARIKKIAAADQQLEQAEEAKRLKKAQPADITQETKKVGSAQGRVDDLKEKKRDMEKARQAKIDAAQQKLEKAEEAKTLKSQQKVDIRPNVKRLENIKGTLNILRAQREDKLDRGQSTDVIDARIEEQKRKRAVATKELSEKVAAGPNTKKEQGAIDKAKAELAEANKPLNSKSINKKISRAESALTEATNARDIKAASGQDTKKEDAEIDKAKARKAEAEKQIDSKEIDKKITRANDALKEAENARDIKKASGQDTKKEDAAVEKAKAQKAEADKPLKSRVIDTKILRADDSLKAAEAARANKKVDTSREDAQLLKLKNQLLELEQAKIKNAQDKVSIENSITRNSTQTQRVEAAILQTDNEILAAKQRIATAEAAKAAAKAEGDKAASSFMRDAKGRVVDENGRVIGKKTSDAGTLKESIREEQKRTGATGKDAKALVAQKMTEDYQEKVFKQLRSDAVGKKEEFDPDLARAKAADLARSSARGRATVQKDAKGNIIGDQRLADTLVGGGRDASGKLKFFERGPKEKKTKEQRQEDSAQRASNISSGIQTGSMFIAGAGAYLASGMKERAGSAESVVGRGDVFGSAPVEKQGKSEAFKESYARAGMLEKSTSYGAAGASAGAAVGAIFGPIGIAVGAGAGLVLGGLVGATKGYADGLKEAEAQIREVKIARSVENLQNIFERVGNGLQDFDASIGQSIKANQKVINEEGGKKAFDTAGGNRDFIDKIFKGGLNTDELQTQLERNSKQNQAQQLVGITSIVNKQAEKTGKQAFAGQIAGGANPANINFKNIEEVIKKGFLEANGGFNKDAISQIASTKNITFEAAEREFIKVIRDSFKSAQLQKTQDLAVKANTNAITSMEMLANAVNAAALASEVFSEKMKTNASLFEGSISGTTISSLSNQLNNKSTPDLSAYNKALDQIAASLGTYGEEFKAQGSALNVAAQELPSILASVIESPIGGADAGVQIADALTKALEAKGIKGEAASRVVNSVAGGVSGQDYTKFLTDAGGNVAKAAEKLLENLKGPFLQASKDIADKLQNASNSYIQGLVELANRQKQVRQSFESIDSKKLQRDKFGAEQKAKGMGLPSQASEFVSYDRLTQGFKNKQARLTENVVGGGENPVEIYKRLQKVQDQIKPQEEKVQNASLSEKGGANFRNAANELLKLKSEASSLNEALKNLSDQSDRLSAAQEKLAKIQRDKETELGIGKRLLTGGPEARQRFGQGQQLLNVAQGQGFNIGNFNDEQAKILFEFVDQFGEKGKDISDRIVKSTTGLGVGTKGKQKEEAALTNEITRIMNAQVEAQQLLTANQKTLQQEYFATLNQQNTTFYTKLDGFIAAMQQQQKQGFINGAEQNIAKLKSAQEGSGFLRRAGVTDQNLDMVNKNKSLIAEIVDSNKRNQSSDEVIKKVKSEDISSVFKDSLSGIKVGGTREDNARAYATNFDSIKNALSEIGVQGDQQKNAILQSFTANLTKDENKGKTTQEILKEAIIQGLASARASEGRTLDAKIAKTGDTTGLFKNIAQQAAMEKINVDQINGALDAVVNLGQGIDTKLTAAIKRAQAALDLLNVPAPAVMPAAGAVPVAPAALFSLGGTAFTPRGSDTVPAMLTPGEFVVNKSAAQQNLPLLQSINSGKTSYLSKGGQVSYFELGGTVPFNDDYPADFKKYNKFLALNSIADTVPFFEGEFGDFGVGLENYIKNATERHEGTDDIARELYNYKILKDKQESTSNRFLATANFRMQGYRTQGSTLADPLEESTGGLNGLKINDKTRWSFNSLQRGNIRSDLDALQNEYAANKDVVFKTGNETIVAGDSSFVGAGKYEKPHYIKKFPEYEKQISDYKEKLGYQDNINNIVTSSENAKSTTEFFELEKSNLYKGKDKTLLFSGYFNTFKNKAESINENRNKYSPLKNLNGIFSKVLYNLIKDDAKENTFGIDRYLNLAEWKENAIKPNPPSLNDNEGYFQFLNYKDITDATQATVKQEYTPFNDDQKANLGGVYKEANKYLDMIKDKKRVYDAAQEAKIKDQKNQAANIAAKPEMDAGVGQKINELNINEIDAEINDPKTKELRRKQLRFKKAILQKVGTGSYYGGKNLVSNEQFNKNAEDGNLVYKNKDLLKNLNDEQYGKKIELEDAVLQGRRGDPQKIAEIFKRRQLEANTVVGKMLSPKRLENVNQKDPKEVDSAIEDLNERGRLFLKEDQTTERLGEKDLKKLPQQQLAIVKSYIENSEFNKTTALKGQDFLDLVTSASKVVPGKENEKDPPRQLIGFDDYLKSRLKNEDDSKTFAGSKDIIEARTKGKYKSLMFQSAELGKAGGQLSYKQLEGKVKNDKNFNIVDKLAAKQKVEKTRFVMPVDGASFDEESGYYYLQSQKVKEKGFLASLNNDAFVGMSFPELDEKGGMITDENQLNNRTRFENIRDLNNFAKFGKSTTTYGSRFGLLTFKDDIVNKDYRIEGEENKTFKTINKDSIIKLFKEQGGTAIIESEPYKEKTGDNGEFKINYERKIKSMVWETAKSVTQQQKLIKEMQDKAKAAAPAVPAGEGNAMGGQANPNAGNGNLANVELEPQFKELLGYQGGKQLQQTTNKFRGGIKPIVQGIDLGESDYKTKYSENQTTKDIRQDPLYVSNAKDKEDRDLFYLTNSIGDTTYIDSSAPPVYKFNKKLPYTENQPTEELIKNYIPEIQGDDFFKAQINANNQLRKASELTVPYGSMFDQGREISINEVKNEEIQKKFEGMVKARNDEMIKFTDIYKRLYSTQLKENLTENNYFTGQQQDFPENEIEGMIRNQEAAPMTERERIDKMLFPGDRTKPTIYAPDSDTYKDWLGTPEQIAEAKEEVRMTGIALADEKLEFPNVPHNELRNRMASTLANEKLFNLTNPPLQKNGGRPSIQSPNYNLNNFPAPEEGGVQKQERLNRKTPQEIKNNKIINKFAVSGYTEGDTMPDDKGGLRKKGNQQQEKQIKITERYINSPTYKAMAQLQSQIDNILLRKKFDVVSDASIYPSNGEDADNTYLRWLNEAISNLRSQDVLTDAYKENFRQELIKKIDLSSLLPRPQNRAKGGIINYLGDGGVPSYAPNPDPSYFKPMGTDTVPAMLTPGEFVVNASATAKHGDLLSAINSGQDVSALAVGGKVSYLYGGGYTQSTARADARSKGVEEGSWGDSMMANFEQGHIQEKNMASSFYQNAGLGTLAETGFGPDAAKSINFSQDGMPGANLAANSGVSSVYDEIKQGGGPGAAFGGLSYRNDSFNQAGRNAMAANQVQKQMQAMMEEQRKQQEEWDNLPEAEKQKIMAKRNVDQILTNAASNSLNVGQYKDRGYGSQVNLMQQRDKIWGTKNYDRYENMQVSSAMANANRNGRNVGQFQRYGRRPVDSVYGQQRASLSGRAGPYERAKYARFSKGGIAHLQFGGNVDTEPAMLSKGEFVVNKDSAQKHSGLLNYINKGREVKKYSKGGGVGVSYLQGGGPAEAQSGSPTQIDGTAIKNAAMTIYAASEKIIDASIKSLEAGRQMIVGGISNAQSASKFLSSSASNLNSSQQMSQSSVDFGSYSQSLGNTLSGFGESISGFSQSLDGFISGITDEFSKLDSTLRNNFGNFNSSVASFAITVDQFVSSIKDMKVKHEHSHKWENELNVNVLLNDNNIINSSELKQLILDTIRGEEFNGI